MKFWGFAIILAVFGLGPSAALAHHGVADYDYKSTVIAKVKVTRFEWANPHCKIHFDATDDKGKATKVEAASVVFERRRLDGEDGKTFKIKPLRPVDELRKEALAAKPPEEKICTTHQVTGQLMPVRECHTAEQWADIRSSGQDSFSQQAQRHAPTTGGKP